MSTVIYRLNRGPFAGVVERHDEGPWSGWYSYTWTVAGTGGGCARIGKSAALAGLNNACLEYFANTAPPGRSRVFKVVEND